MLDKELIYHPLPPSLSSLVSLTLALALASLTFQHRSTLLLHVPNLERPYHICTMATVPITDWGDLELYTYCLNSTPQFTIDARPFADMVDAVYQSLQPRLGFGDEIPFGLFRYYCMLLWWFRSLWLHRSNGHVLSTEESRLLNFFSSLQDLHIPLHIAQYLANMGNFQAGDQIFYFQQLPSLLCSFEDDTMVVKRGWFSANGTAGPTTAKEFWRYTQQPSPGVFTSYVRNEANWALGFPNSSLTLDRVAPAIDGQKAHPTHNIIGWSNTAHSRAQYWRATYSQLGWSASGIPSDCYTEFNISPSTLKWVSKRLRMLKCYSGYPLGRVNLSTQGSTIQSNFLATEEESEDDQRPKFCRASNNKMNGSQHSDVSVSSCFPLDPSTLSASFCFGYRMIRNRVYYWESEDESNPWYGRSNYQPWLFTSVAKTAYLDLPEEWFTNMNQTFKFGSHKVLNHTRFCTNSMTRSTDILSALFLADGAN